MADTVSSVEFWRNNRGEYGYRFQNRSDGTGESAVVKIDASALTNADGASGTGVQIDRVEWSVSGFDYVHAYWDRDTDVDIATLSGSGVSDYSFVGGFNDIGTGGTGDVVFTTSGGAAGSSYDVTVYFQVK